MDNPRQVPVPIILKGLNYVLWSRMIKTALGGRGLGDHLSLGEAPPRFDQDGEGNEVVVVDEEKWRQEDLYVLSILQNSLDGPILEAYSHCETAHTLWEILKKVYGNTTNLSRIFQVKQAINNLHNEDLEFTALFGKFSSLWAEHDMLRPTSFDPEVLKERSEQDRVFSLLMVLSPAYNDLIKHILRSDKLPSLEDVCSQIQKERGSHGLFGGKGDLLTAHKSVYSSSPSISQRVDSISANRSSSTPEYITANKGYYKADDRKIMVCDHCKKKGHTKDKCWILHPHLKPAKWKDAPKAHYTQEAGHYVIKGNPPQSGSQSYPATPTYQAGSSSHGVTSQPTQLVSYQPSPSEYVTKSDLEALIKAFKDHSGNVVGRSLHASFNAFHMTKPLIVDSGASHHMISDLNLIKNVQPALGNVLIANGANVPIEGIGDLRLFNKESKAFYMPSFTSNLLSVKRATTDLNCHAIFGPNDFVFQDIETHEILGQGGTKNDLYVLEDLAPSSLVTCFSNNAMTDGDLWHARLGHPHLKALEMMFPRISFDNNACEACILGKHCRSVFPKSQTVYEKCFDLVHSDVWTAPCSSRENHKYFVSFIDEKSKYTWVTLLPSKGRVLEAFMNFNKYVTNQFDAKIKHFRSDNGGEYTSQAFKHYLTKHGIEHQTSCPYTPQQNGVAERKNRHLMEVTRAMMFHMKVPKRFWADALVAACYLINRIPTKTLHDVSPYEVLNNLRPSLDHIRVFGCVCFVFVPGEQRNKLEARSTKAMFLGYSTTQKGYKCYNAETNRVLISRDVKFLESKSYFDEGTWDAIKDIASNPSDRADSLRRILENLGQTHPTSHPSAQPPASSSQLHSLHPVGGSNASHDEDNEENSGSGSSGSDREDHTQSRPHLTSTTSGFDHDQSTRPSNLQDESGSSLHGDSETEVSMEGDQELEAPVELRRSTRQRFPPSNWKNTRVYYNSNAVAHPTQATCNLVHIPQEHQVFIGSLDQELVPKSYEEAKKLKVWRDAVGDERGAMERNHTWDESDLPKGKRAVSSRWIFTIKYKSNGEIERHKARLVARGFTQTYGDDYRDTFAPVAKMHTIRVVLSMAANLDWELWQMDVKNAFLQGELEEEVYMTPPPGMEDSVAPGKVLRLRKAIYGLKQSPRAWYHKLNVTLRDRGFRRSESDHTLFTLQSSAGIVVILIYVDDIIISGNDKVGVASTKEYLKSMFDIKDLGVLKYFLGIEVCRFKDGLFISQRKYIADLLTNAGMENTKEAKTPLEDGYKVEPEGEQEEDAFEDPKLYRRLVGKLIYLTITRPDLCFSVNQVSQHMQAPKMSHWRMVHRILRYLKGTSTQGIWMGKNDNTEIVGYCDADWAGDRKDRRSTTGYCTFIGGNLVTWKTKKQKVVSCSSAEAEYRAMRKLTTECIWLKALLLDLGVKIETPITMHCDNQAAIHIASNSVFHERTKHIEVDCHKVREAVEKGVILPCYTRSSEQLADIFTKAASTKVCEFIHSKLGLTSLPF